MWLNMHSDDGIIALDDEYVEKMGLPVSQRFPWDQNKGIYLLHGFHNLHCTVSFLWLCSNVNSCWQSIKRSIYISLMKYRKNIPQTRNHHHIIHCLDALRRDVLCNADDIPRYTTPDPSPETGNGQPRMCRSWDKMHDCAKQHNACHRYIHEQSSNYPEVQRFVWCPEGSPYRKEVDKYFIVDYDTPRASGIDWVWGSSWRTELERCWVGYEICLGSFQVLSCFLFVSNILLYDSKRQVSRP